MHNTWIHFFDYVNTVILLYFLAANSVYTFLMVISLYTVSLHSKFAARVGYGELADSPVTPPVALIVPAHNEQDAVVTTVSSLLDLNYPEKEIVVVDDGSTDDTALRLIEHFQLQRMDLVYREAVPAKKPFAFYHNPEVPELLLLSKENGGKADALNVGISMS